LRRPFPGQRVFYHHIASRSPWRRRGSSALRVPDRVNMVSLVIGDLPRPGPDALEVGRDAWRVAREATLTALDSKFDSDCLSSTIRLGADGRA
jgi:NTE family protein